MDALAVAFSRELSHLEGVEDDNDDEKINRLKEKDVDFLTRKGCYLSHIAVHTCRPVDAGLSPGGTPAQPYLRQRRLRCVQHVPRRVFLHLLQVFKVMRKNVFFLFLFFSSDVALRVWFLCFCNGQILGLLLVAERDSSRNNENNWLIRYTWCSRRMKL